MMSARHTIIILSLDFIFLPPLFFIPNLIYEIAEFIIYSINPLNIEDKNSLHNLYFINPTASPTPTDTPTASPTPTDEPTS